MIHFAIAGGIILGASAISWFYNQKTDEEIYRQERAYKERDNIREKYKSASDSSQQNYMAQQKKQAQAHKALLLMRKLYLAKLSLQSNYHEKSSYNNRKSTD